ncbi:MAG: metallophosphoesterase [Oscillospiraceae bacterium]|nr:metallophosphoesterase [Oscillospiraceae bacterium]
MGSLSDKLTYLAATKTRFMQAMSGLGYEVTPGMTLRDAVNLLYAEAIEKQIEDFDVSSLPAYWGNDVKAALAYTMTLGTDYVHHLVTTDNHYNINYRKSPSIMSLLQSTGLFGRVINLGDITDSHTQAQADAVLADYQPFAGNMLFAIGNHDDSGAGSASVLYPLIENDTTLQGTPETFNYYWDDAAHKIRYIVYNSPNVASFTPVETWAKGVPDGWAVLILSHYAGMSFMSDFSQAEPVSAGTRTPYAKNLRPFFMANDNKFFAGWIAGHEHTDSLAVDTPFGVIHQAVLNNDGHSNDAAPWPKTQGTATEQAVTIMSINPKAKIVKFYRIGAVTRYGRSFEYSYAKPASGQGHWIPDYWINSTPDFQSGTGDAGKRAFLWSELLPLQDENGNKLTYQVYSKSGVSAYWFYGIAMDENYTVTRVSTPKAALGAFNIGNGNPPRGSGSQPGMPSDAKYAYIAVEWNSADIDASDLVLTDNPMLETLVSQFGVGFSNVVWRENYWIATPPVTLGSDTGTAVALYVIVKPGARYRLYVDDSGYTTSKPFCQIYGINRWRESAQILYQSKGKGSALPITFTVPETCGLICIGLGDAVGFTDKIRLEEVTA